VDGVHGMEETIDEGCWVVDKGSFGDESSLMEIRVTMWWFYLMCWEDHCHSGDGAVLQLSGPFSLMKGMP